MAAIKSAPKPPLKAPPAPPAPKAVTNAPAAPPPSAPTKDVENVVPGTVDPGTVNAPPAATTGNTEAAGSPVVRKSAVIEAFNFDEEMVVPERAKGQRESKWTAVLDRLYTATEQGLVKRNEDQSLKFTKIGHYLNVNGARSQIQIFKQDEDVNAAYEFKTLPSLTPIDDEPHAGSDLWARVREVAADDAAPEAPTA